MRSFSQWYRSLLCSGPWIDIIPMALTHCKWGMCMRERNSLFSGLFSLPWSALLSSKYPSTWNPASEEIVWNSTPSVHPVKRLISEWYPLVNVSGQGMALLGLELSELKTWVNSLPYSNIIIKLVQNNCKSLPFRRRKNGRQRVIESIWFIEKLRNTVRISNVHQSFRSFQFPSKQGSLSHIHSATPLEWHCKGWQVMRVENVLELLFDHDLQKDGLWPSVLCGLKSVFIILVHVWSGCLETMPL